MEMARMMISVLHFLVWLYHMRPSRKNGAVRSIAELNTSMPIETMTIIPVMQATNATKNTARTEPTLRRTAPLSWRKN